MCAYRRGKSIFPSQDRVDTSTEFSFGFSPADLYLEPIIENQPGKDMTRSLLIIAALLLTGCSTMTVREVEQADRSMIYKASKAEVFQALLSYCEDEDWELERKDLGAGVVQSAWKYWSPEVTYRERKKFTAELKPRGRDTEVVLSMIDEMQDIKTSRWISNRMGSSNASNRYTEILEGIGTHLDK